MKDGGAGGCSCVSLTPEAELRPTWERHPWHELCHSLPQEEQGRSSFLVAPPTTPLPLAHLWTRPVTAKGTGHTCVSLSTEDSGRLVKGPHPRILSWYSAGPSFFVFSVLAIPFSPLIYCGILVTPKPYPKCYFLCGASQSPPLPLFHIRMIPPVWPVAFGCTSSQHSHHPAF